MTLASETNEDFHILALDGGGTRGIYGAQVLAKVEETLGAEVRECFDLIVGASTGSIIAGAAAAGIPMKDVVSLFENDSPRIFKKIPLLWRNAKCCRAEGQRNHIRLSLQAFLRLEAHRLSAGVSWYESKANIIRSALRDLPGLSQVHSPSNCVTPTSIEPSTASAYF